MQFIVYLGDFFLLLKKVFTKPEKPRIFFKRIIDELDLIGLGSLPIVAILSLFMGGVMLVQSAYNFSAAWVPSYAEGLATRDTMILEFSPTMIGLVLAGKVGSSIAGQLGTMKVTEQIDAMEIMGVNPQNYLILPKIIAGVIIFPMLCVISIFLGVIGGYVMSWATGVVAVEDYLYGVQFDFETFYVNYALLKSVIFGFVITSLSSYQGYRTRGGAKEVGNSSTKAVVFSCIIILLFDLIVTKILMQSV